MSLFSTGAFSVLQYRNYRFYLLARVMATIAVQMQSVAIGWQVYAKTGSMFDLATIGLAQFAPFLVLILFAGQAADRYNRRSIIAWCMALQGVCGLLLLGYTLADPAAVWPVFAVLVLFGSSRAFMMPATQAIVINMVPKESFSKAVALSSSSFHAAVIAGPILGGFLYLAGPATVYATVASLLAVSVMLMLAIRFTPVSVNREPVSLASLFEGLRFVWSRPVVLGAISLDLFAVLFGGATALLPAYARDVLDAGPTMLGLLRTAPGVGAATTSIVLAFFPIGRHVGRWMFGGVALFGLGAIVLGNSGNVYVALAALALMGVGDMVSVFIRHILVQYETPDAIRGRVSAVSAVFIGASNELGEFESGLTAGWFGLTRALVLGGACTLAVVGIWMWRFPMLRTMDRFPHVVGDAGAQDAPPQGHPAPPGRPLAAGNK